ncbi:MAG: response regulator transcription factor [Chthoniobacteraceae bacterium]
MRILIVEDNDRLRKSLLDYLREEGFATDGAASGEEALYHIAHYEYDAIALDIMIPEPDGFEVLKKIRQTGVRTPVLMLTARGSLTDRLHGLNSGADDYLIKPFDMEELVARLRAIIRRAASDPNPVIHTGAVTLNTAACAASIGGQPVELTTREFALLELLIRRRGAVVSRDEINEHLMDERDDSMSNLLDVYIYRLRQKFGKTRIQTRRGMGYQWSA